MQGLYYIINSSVHSLKEIEDALFRVHLCPCGGKLKEVSEDRYWFSGTATGFVYECIKCRQWWLVDKEIKYGPTKFKTTSF